MDGWLNEWISIYINQFKKMVVRNELRTKMSTYRPRSFTVSGPTSWNSLPQSFCDATPTARTIPKQTENVAVPFGLRMYLTAHSWMSRLSEWHSINERTKLNWMLESRVKTQKRQKFPVRFTIISADLRMCEAQSNELKRRKSFYNDMN